MVIPLSNTPNFTEIFDRGFLYLLVGKVGGTKIEMDVDLQEF